MKTACLRTIAAAVMLTVAPLAVRAANAVVPAPTLENAGGTIVVKQTDGAASLVGVAIVVRARLAGMDESLTEAARDCGATPLQAFRYITLPLIMPGILAAGLLAGLVLALTPVAALTPATPRAILLAAQLTIRLAMPGPRRCRPLPAWPTWTG